MQWLLEWQHLVFLIPLFFGMLLVSGSLTGLIGHGDVDHEFHVAEADHDVAGDADHDVEQDPMHAAHVVAPEQHTEAHGHHDLHDRGLVAKTLSLLGIGRVPLSIILTTASFLWGGIGMAVSFVVEPVLGIGFVSGGIAVVVAWFAMTVGTGSLARLIARVMPSSETYRITKRDLIGRTGTALFAIASQSSGYVQVNDHEGNLHQVRVCVRDEEIPKGSTVLLYQYDHEEDLYFARSAPMVGAA